MNDGIGYAHNGKTDLGVLKLSVNSVDGAVTECKGCACENCAHYSRFSEESNHSSSSPEDTLVLKFVKLVLNLNQDQKNLTTVLLLSLLL